MQVNGRQVFTKIAWYFCGTMPLELNITLACMSKFACEKMVIIAGGRGEGA